jgi:hypothetical protein
MWLRKTWSNVQQLARGNGISRRSLQAVIIASGARGFDIVQAARRCRKRWWFAH